MIKLNSSEYWSVHSWLRKTFGKANKCESAECKGTSKNFEWALIKGKEYHKVRENYMMLCISCHRKYDLDKDSTRLKMSIAKTGERNNMYGISIKGKDHHFYGKHHTIETRKKLHQYQAKLNDSEIDDLRTLYSLGIKQSILSDEFKISRASVCRIVNNKRYLLCQ